MTDDSKFNFDFSGSQFNVIITKAAPCCDTVVGVRLENGIYGHSRFCNTDFDDKLACLNLSGV